MILAQGPRDLGLPLRARGSDSVNARSSRQAITAAWRRGDMEQICDGVPCLDVHRHQVAACVRMPGPRGGVHVEKAWFKISAGDLAVLAGWLAGPARSRGWRTYSRTPGSSSLPSPPGFSPQSGRAMTEALNARERDPGELRAGHGQA